MEPYIIARRRLIRACTRHELESVIGTAKSFHWNREHLEQHILQHWDDETRDCLIKHLKESVR